MKRILSILLVLALLLTLAGAAAETQTGTAYTTANAADGIPAEERAPYAVSGHAFTAPASWRVMGSSDPENGTIAFDMGSGSIMSLMMVAVQDASEMTPYLDVMGLSGIYESLMQTLAGSYNATAIGEEVAWGQMEGYSAVLTAPEEVIVCFLSLQGRELLVIMEEDPSMTEWQLIRLAREIVETMAW